jgi:thermitase
MRWTFSVRGKPVTLTRLEGVVAVRPSAEPEGQAERRQLVEQFGSEAGDEPRGSVSVPGGLPSLTRQRFERAGWLFVEPRPALAKAVAARQPVPGTRAVRPVYLDRFGNLLVGTDLVVVQLPPDVRGATSRSRLDADGLRALRRLRFASNTFEARLPPGPPVDEALARLHDGGCYRVAEPELLEGITGRLRPTDPDYPKQWQHAAIHSEEAWDVTRGCGPDRPVRLAVVDHGMQTDHPDLAAGIVGGGHFQSDGVGGAHLVPGTAAIPSRGPSADHGTSCLGMAGARMDNGQGGCGSAPEADLLAVACLDDEVGTQATLARALAYAAYPRCEDAEADADGGADVISCSLGGNGAGWDLTWVLDRAIRFVTRFGRAGRGVPLFFAVADGNCPIEQDRVCSHPRVIAVGQSDSNDKQGGSAYGPKLELLAPGVAVWATRSPGWNGQVTGTSFAAPLAAGVAALVLARYPTWTRRRVRRRLRHTCDKVGGVVYDHRGHDDRYGFGRLNAARAVR